MARLRGVRRPRVNTFTGGTIGGIVFMLFFGGFWSAITLAFDVMIVRNIYQQTRALSYPTTTGWITLSEIEADSDSDGTTYRPKIHFSYRVGDNLHTSTQHRYGSMGSSSRSDAERAVKMFPVGRETVVRYHPQRHDDAVLLAGIEGSDLFLPMFMMPFNVVMLAIWAAAGGGLWQRIAPRPAGGAKIIDDGLQIRARVDHFSPLATALIVAAGISFVGVFVLGFSMGFNPPLWVMLIAWGVIGTGAILGYFRQWSKSAGGVNDLIIDPVRQTLLLPATQGREAPLLVPASSVHAIELEGIEHRDSDGDVSHRYAPTVILTDADDGHERRERVCEWHDKKCAEGLAGWLREKLRLAESGSRDDPS